MAIVIVYRQRGILKCWLSLLAGFSSYSQIWARREMD
jgi:hypothetical protein